MVSLPGDWCLLLSIVTLVCMLVGNTLCIWWLSGTLAAVKSASVQDREPVPGPSTPQDRLLDLQTPSGLYMLTPPAAYEVTPPGAWEWPPAGFDREPLDDPSDETR